MYKERNEIVEIFYIEGDDVVPSLKNQLISYTKDNKTNKFSVFLSNSEGDSHLMQYRYCFFTIDKGEIISIDLGGKSSLHGYDNKTSTYIIDKCDPTFNLKDLNLYINEIFSRADSIIDSFVMICYNDSPPDDYFGDCYSLTEKEDINWFLDNVHPWSIYDK